MKIRFLLRFSFLLLACSLFGQNTRVDGVVYRASGFPAAGALIAVCTQPAVIGTSVAACTPLASLCSSATDLVCTSPNPVTADGLGNYNFYVKPGKYSYQFYGSGLTTRLQTDQTISPALDTNNPFTGSDTFALLNTLYFADGTKYPLTQAGVQQAFTDACTAFPGGTEVYLPASSIALHNQASQLLLVTCPLNIHGVGPLSTIFVVDAGISSSIPVIRVKMGASPNDNHFRLSALQIKSAGAATAGDGILFDNTNDTGGPVTVDIGPHYLVSSGQLNGYAVNTSSPTGGAGQLMWSIHDSVLGGGIKFDAIADSMTVWHNNFGTASGSTHACIEMTVAGGAAQQSIIGNNGGCAGGVLILHDGSQILFENNQFEQTVATTEANSAMIDLQCDVTFCSDVRIIHNNLNSHDNVTNLIRLDRANNTHIEDNTLNLKTTTGVGILMTANPIGTRIPYNTYGNAGGGTVNISNPSSTPNIIMQGTDGTAAQPSLVLTVNRPTTGWFNDTANSCIGFSWAGAEKFCQSAGGFFNQTNQLSNLSGTIVGWTSSTTDVLTTPMDTALTRIKAGLVGVGTGGAGSTAGLLLAGNKVFVASDFTTTSVTLATITGLSWTVPLSAQNYSFHCALSYSQATAAVANAFGIQAASIGPTNIFATGQVFTSATVVTTGVLPTLSTTTATNIVAFTPSATATNFVAYLDGTIENSANANTFNIMALTGNASDALTIKRGSYCTLY